MNKHLLINSLAIAITVAAGAAAAQTDNYPAKPVRMISPFPPGGSVDTVGRLIAARLTEAFGQQFVIDTHSGASGNIGMELAAKAPPDGYTLVVNTIPLVTNQFLYEKVPYDALRDFAPITLLTSTASVMLIHPSLPVKNVADVVTLARARGSSLTYGSSGPGTNPHISGELFNYLAKTNITVVHFRGGGPALIAQASGEVQMGFPAIPDSIPFIRNGRLRALGVTSLKRVPQMPDVPPIADTLPGYEFITWQGLLAPRNTPRAIVDALQARLKKGLSVPENTKRFNDLGLDVVISTPDEFTAFIKKETEKWGKVIRERGMKAD